VLGHADPQRTFVPSASLDLFLRSFGGLWYRERMGGHRGRVMNILLGVAMGCGGGGGGGTADAPSAPSDAMPDACPDNPQLVYLNRSGGDYTQGPDDASTNTSAVLQQASQSVTASSVDNALWTQVVACMADRLAPFNIRVTETDPGSAPHREAVFVDSLAELGFSAGVSAIAPSRCPMQDAPDPLQRAILFTATTIFGTNARDICENALMSLGFTFYLDRTLHAPDIMSYFASQTPKRFVDMQVPCGDTDARDCLCGGTTQSSYQKLLAYAGPGCQ
jgi:hypothetical protein